MIPTQRRHRAILSHSDRQLMLFLVAPSSTSRLCLLIANWSASSQLVDLNIYFDYINTCEIPGFLLLLRNYIFIARSEDSIFIFHMRG